MLKLNRFLEKGELKKRQIKIIEGNFLDDGLFLWNQTTGMLCKYFEITGYKRIYDGLFLLDLLGVEGCFPGEDKEN